MSKFRNRIAAWLHAADLPVPPESTAKCPQCPAMFAAPTEREAGWLLWRHLTGFHDEPPTP